jgi:hypothetical protein
MIINHLQGLTGTWAETNTQLPLRQESQKIKHEGVLFSGKEVSTTAFSGCLPRKKERLSGSFKRSLWTALFSGNELNNLQQAHGICGRFAYRSKHPFLTEGPVAASLTVFFLREIFSYV